MCRAEGRTLPGEFAVNAGRFSDNCALSGFPPYLENVLNRSLRAHLALVVRISVLGCVERVLRARAAREQKVVVHKLYLL